MSDNAQLADQAELFVAALKIVSVREGRAPSVVEIGKEVAIKRERAHFLANRLADVGAIRIVPAPFEERVYLEDWAKVSDLREREAPPAVDELQQQQQAEREEKAKQINARFDPSVRAGEKQDLFAQLKAQLKDPRAGRKPNPLDALKKKDEPPAPAADEEEPDEPA